MLRYGREPFLINKGGKKKVKKTVSPSSKLITPKFHSRFSGKDSLLVKEISVLRKVCQLQITNVRGFTLDAHLHTRGPGIHPRVEDRNNDTPAIVLGILGEKLSDTRLFLRQQAPNRKVTIDDVCHVSSATATVTAGKPPEMFPLYCRSLILYISIEERSLRLRARHLDAPVFEVRLTADDKCVRRLVYVAYVYYPLNSFVNVAA